MTCSNCGKPITTTYYDVNGNHVCPVCRGKLLKSAPKGGAFLSALGYGIGACLLGALIYFAVAAIFNLELALVAILIGYMVGLAVRKGARGNGGRKYQIMAAALVYISVGLAYTGLVIKLAMDAKTTASARAASRPAAASADSDAATADSANADDGNGNGAAASEDASGLPTEKFSSNSSIFLKIGAAFLMVFSLPIVFIIGSLPSGIISVLIIGFGMRQAWRMTAGEEVGAMTVTGPYRINPPAQPST